MMRFTTPILALFGLLFLSSCDVVSRVKRKAKRMNHYEKAALHLAKENRQLKAKVNDLEYELESLRAKHHHLSTQLKKEGPSREVASIAPVYPEKDLVKYHIYQWSPAQILSMAEKSFEEQNYEKSAQLYQTFVSKFPGSEHIDDNVLFKTGLAAYESGNRDQWVLENLGKLVQDYPTSPYYRGAKLWMALTHLKHGDHDSFFETVEEFRKKYRNTSEWKILSAHYEKILQKYKR